MWLTKINKILIFLLFTLPFYILGNDNAIQVFIPAAYILIMCLILVSNKKNDISAKYQSYKGKLYFSIFINSLILILLLFVPFPISMLLYSLLAVVFAGAIFYFTRVFLKASFDIHAVQYSYLKLLFSTIALLAFPVGIYFLIACFKTRQLHRTFTQR
jgi:hypothetical protein